MLSSLCSFLSLLKADPGRIHKKNIKTLQKKYPYDNLLYTNNECKTCKMIKIARSKHCALCNICIEKQDHHCVWINGCVGGKNYKYFLWFLIAHSIMCLDIAFITTYIYKEIIRRNQLFKTQFINYRTKEVYEATWGIVIQWLLIKYPDLLFVLVLCLAMGVALTSFFIFHLTLVAKNQTANESNKQSDILHLCEKALERNTQLLAELTAAKEKGPIAEKEPQDEIENVEVKEKRNKEKKKEEKKVKKEEVDLKVVEDEIKAIKKKIEALNGTYFYNKGFKNNLKEVLYPNQ